jgi:hypothetical protein
LSVVLIGPLAIAMSRHNRIFSSLLAALGVFAGPAQAAEDLKLRDGISFYQDVGGFPIIAEHMDDVTLSGDRPALIFFGASGDLNTNRQARRLVDLYRRYRTSPLKFIVIDVDHPQSTEARNVVKQHYKGYIPSQILLARDGHPVWNQIGEVDLKIVQSNVEKVLH